MKYILMIVGFIVFAHVISRIYDFLSRKYDFVEGCVFGGGTIILVIIHIIVAIFALSQCSQSCSERNDDYDYYDYVTK